jgi:hypothetical protein
VDRAGGEWGRRTQCRWRGERQTLDGARRQPRVWQMKGPRGAGCQPPLDQNCVVIVFPADGGALVEG